MLILREYKLDESEEIKEILIKEDIKDLELEGLVYVVLDGNDLIGITKAEKNDVIYELKYLVIKHERRGENLGDALLRALVSKLDNQGVEIVFFIEKNDYLIKKGFILSKNNKLELNISNFFDGGCKCQRNRN